MRRLLVSAIVVLTVAIGAAQQEQFEVASVKLASFVPGPGAPVPSLKVSGNQLHIRVYPLLSLLTYIFEPPAGTFFYPDWVRTPDIRLEIDAVMPDGRGNKPDVQQMLRALLAERMGLTFHVEQRRIAAFDHAAYWHHGECSRRADRCRLSQQRGRPQAAGDDRAASCGTNSADERSRHRQPQQGTD